MKLLKYLTPFFISTLAFSFLGFYPTDCSNENNVNCETVRLSDCSWEDIELKGRVQFVESFPDFKIQFVESFPDIKVKFVTSFPDDCGEWQVVETYPDFKVQVVESFPDIKIKLVSSFPGMK